MNAVATALKDFFSKKLPALFDKELMEELEEIAGKILYYVQLVNYSRMFYLSIDRGITF